MDLNAPSRRDTFPARAPLDHAIEIATPSQPDRLARTVGRILLVSLALLAAFAFAWVVS